MNAQFFVDQKPLMAILSSMQPICTKRTTLDITSSILIEVGHKELVIKSTDLEISLQASCPIQESSLEAPCAFLVSGRRLFEVIKELEGAIAFDVDGKQLTLKTTAVNLALHIRNAEEFPPFPERIENMMHIEGPFLLDMLEKVSFLIPQNNANPALNGLKIDISADGLTMTTTDGHCLAQMKTQKYTLAEPKSWLVPRRAIFELKRLIESIEDKTIFVGLCNNQLVFSGEAFNFFTKLLADPFPQYETILQRDGFKAATIDRMRLIKMLRRSTCLLSGQFIATQFGFAPHVLRVSMNNKDVGTLVEEAPLKGFDGEELDVRFYAPYLLSGLQVFGDEQIDFYLKSSSKPIIFESRNEQNHLIYLVMPVSPTMAA